MYFTTCMYFIVKKTTYYVDYYQLYKKQIEKSNVSSVGPSSCFSLTKGLRQRSKL